MEKLGKTLMKISLRTILWLTSFEKTRLTMEKIRLMKIFFRTISWLTSFEKTRLTMEKLGKTLMKMSHNESRNDKESSDV